MFITASIIVVTTFINKVDVIVNSLKYLREGEM